MYWVRALYTVTAQIGASGARVEFLTCALHGAVVQGSLQECAVNRAFIPLRNSGARCTAIILYYASAQCKEITMRDTITVVTGHVPTKGDALYHCNIELQFPPFPRTSLKSHYSDIPTHHVRHRTSTL